MFVNVKGRKIYYKFINESLLNKDIPLIIFLHEGLGSCSQWKDFPETISNMLKCPALIYDRYGYGKSDMIKGIRNFNYLQEEGLEMLPELISMLNIKNRLILFGHSDGGSIALIYASQYRSSVIGIITEADHVIIEDLSVDGIKGSVKEFEKKDSKFKEHLIKYHKEKTDSMFYSWANNWLSERAKDWNIEKELSAIIAPTLIIQGHDDNYGSIQQIFTKMKHIKGTVEVLYIPKCGHIPHYQAKDMVQKRIIEFISNLSDKLI